MVTPNVSNFGEIADNIDKKAQSKKSESLLDVEQEEITVAPGNRFGYGSYLEN